MSKRLMILVIGGVPSTKPTAMFFDEPTFVDDAEIELLEKTSIGAMIGMFPTSIELLLKLKICRSPKRREGHKLREELATADENNDRAATVHRQIQA